MTLPAADRDADGVYDLLRDSFGEEDPKASGYRSAFSFRKERDLILAVLRRACDPQRPLLDLACGAGLMTRPLIREGWRVFGLDFNQAACRRAAHNGLLTVRGDAFALPVAPGVMGNVVATEFIQQYDGKAVAVLLAEMARILEPGGCAVLIWRNGRAGVHRVAQTVFSLLDRLAGRKPLTLVNHSVAEMNAEAVRCGLEPLEIKAIFPPFSLVLEHPEGLGARLIGSSYIGLFRKA